MLKCPDEHRVQRAEEVQMSKHKLRSTKRIKITAEEMAERKVKLMSWWVMRWGLRAKEDLVNQLSYRAL